jgi:glycosyltransferase involved in cell wall biosynthesis
VKIRFDVAYIGRLSPEKGVLDLIECILKLENLRAVIIGSGEQAEKIKSKIGHITNRILLTGFLSGVEKQKYLEQALMLVIPSKCYEQLPMTAMEGMAAGKPIVAPNQGSWPFIIQNGKTGLLFEPGNAEDLYNKVSFLTQNPNLTKEMGKSARVSCFNQFSEERYYKELMNLYSQNVNR